MEGAAPVARGSELPLLEGAVTHKVFMVAVESSGQALGMEILDAAQEAGLKLVPSGVVGEGLRASGVVPIADGDCLAVIGIMEALRHYGALRRLMARIAEHLRRERPALAILIDHPAFNLRVAGIAKELGIPVLYVVSPQVWAWRPGRIHRIARLVDHMMVLFPFEAKIYEGAGVPVTVLAHPLLARCSRMPGREAARAALGLPAQGEILALLPGSRRSELERMLPRFARTVAELRALRPASLPVVALAQPEHVSLLEATWSQAVPDAPLPEIRIGRAGEVLAAADAVLVASGTATLEAALVGRPAVVVYAVHPLTYAIARRLVRTPFIAMPNILLGEAVYPEYVQDAFDPETVARRLVSVLGAEGARQRERLRGLPALLHGEGLEAIGKVLARIFHQTGPEPVKYPG